MQNNEAKLFLLKQLGKKADILSEEGINTLSEIIIDFHIMKSETIPIPIKLAEEILATLKAAQQDFYVASTDIIIQQLETLIKMAASGL